MVRSFQTKRLLLSSIHPSDAIHLLPIWADRDVVQFMNIEPMHSIDEATKMITLLTELTHERKAARYTIFRKDMQVAIGSAGFNVIQDGEAEIGYEIGKTHWGLGFGTEVLHALEEMASRYFNLHYLYAFVDLKNERSIHLLTKLGYEKQSTEQNGLQKYTKKIEA